MTEVFEPRLREQIDPIPFRAAMRNRTIERLERRAKYLLLKTSGDRTLLVHLGMSGNLSWTKTQVEREKHDHVRFHLDDGSLLNYCDPRRFGLLAVVENAQLATDKRLAHLGVEPLSAGLDGNTLRTRAGGRRRRIKEFLMDQTVMVGVGNIYASEALHRAGVHPGRMVSRVSLATWNKVVAAIQETLTRAIDRGGSTLNDFRDGTGESGYFQIEHAVYDREGEPCLRCGASIRRSVFGNRSTYYCPGCQH